MSGRGVGNCRSLMSRPWFNPGATSSSSSAALTRGWLTAPHESQAHGSPVCCNGPAMRRTHGNAWQCCLRHHNAPEQGLWQQAIKTAHRAGCSQWPLPNQRPIAQRCPWASGEHVLEPSVIVEPQAKRHTTDGSNRSRSWLEPSATWNPGQTPTHARSRSPVSRELSAELASRSFEPDACHR